MPTFSVPDMSCGHCKAAIEKAIGGADSAAKIEFDMEARTIDVTSDLSLADLTALLGKEGYPSTLEA